MTYTPPAEAIEASRAALEQRLSWASLDWPNLYPNMIDAIIGTVVPAAGPLMVAQAKAEALAPILALHKPVEISYFDGDDDEFSATCCDHCTISQDVDSLVRWPCPTARVASIKEGAGE